MIERKLKPTIIDLLNSFRGVYLYGARQVGKTTLARQVANALDWRYLSFDDVEVRDFAQNFTDKFFDRFTLPLVIDEVQKVPEIIPYIKIRLDTNPKPGQILLTGSADFRKMYKIKESLVGRVVGIQMRGFACSEISLTPTNFIDKLFNAQTEFGEYTTDLEKFVSILTKGSFPELALSSLSTKELHLWYEDYVNSRILSDLQEITTIRAKEKIISFIYKLAWQSSGILNTSELASMTGVSRPTAEKFFEVLNSLFLVETLKPYYPNIAKRFTKQPKIFLTDSGLMSFLLDLAPEKLLKDRTLLGRVFETWVYNELQKEISFASDTYKLFYFRDERKNEIDFIVENTQGERIAIEVKAKSRIKDEDLKPLSLLISKLKIDKAYIIYLGDHLLPKNAGEREVWLLPVGYFCKVD